MICSNTYDKASSSTSTISQTAPNGRYYYQKKYMYVEGGHTKDSLWPYICRYGPQEGVTSDFGRNKPRSASHVRENGVSDEKYISGPMV
jgi:hypothetical protein